MQNHEDLIRAAAEDCDEPIHVVRSSVNSYLSAIRSELGEEGAEVKLGTLGKFTTKMTAARTGRNPSNGEPVDIPARLRTSFKVLSGLKW